jgi:hypothetical protein
LQTTGSDVILHNYSLFLDTNNTRTLFCDVCDQWVHIKCCNIKPKGYDRLQNSSCTWFCAKCGLSNFSLIFLTSITYWNRKFVPVFIWYFIWNSRRNRYWRQYKKKKTTTSKEIWNFL